MWQESNEGFVDNVREWWQAIEQGEIIILGALIEIGEERFMVARDIGGRF